MVIKPLEPIADIGASSAARRITQRPAAPEPAQQIYPQLGGAPEQQANAEQKQAAAEAQSQAQAHVPDPSIRFHVDQDSGRTIAEIVDTEGQVLRQMPTEEALQIAKAIGKYQGMFVDLKV